MGTVVKRLSGLRIEWPTAWLIVSSYSIWLLLLFFDGALTPIFWIGVAAVNITLFMSITHEVVHKHPTNNVHINRLLVLLPIGWSIPFERFRDTHLAHHYTGELTDPFDDPESWYLSHDNWLRRRSFFKALLRFNNTLFGRMLIGPLIGLGRFYACEFMSILNDTTNRFYLLKIWGQHLVLCAFMIFAISYYSAAPLWQWFLSIYLGHSLLYIRTFLEHQAAPDHSERTVIIEQACPLSFLFLFNNYHFIHHTKPRLAWYRLPAEYRKNREDYIAQNGAYVYASYAEVFRKFFLRSKEPVFHPYLRTDT